MKVLWLKNIKFYFILASILVMSIFCSSDALSEQKLLTRKQAAIVAEQTPEVQALYELNNGRFRNCIVKETLKPCDSNWVTCVEDAWVVKFWPGEICSLKADGRLSVTILVDAVTGNIISRYPEVDYFESSLYCLESYDCMESNKSDEREQHCVNFIYGQIQLDENGEQMYDSSESCKCENHQCFVVRE